MRREASKNVSSLWRFGVVLAALYSTAAMPPISQQARAALDRTLGTKGVYVDEESAYKFVFPRTDISVQVGRQRLSSAQAPRSWATFSPSMLKALRARDFTVTSIHKRAVAEHPESLFIGVWKQGTALELARGLRFALDVEVGAAKVAANSERK